MTHPGPSGDRPGDIAPSSARAAFDVVAQGLEQALRNSADYSASIDAVSRARDAFDAATAALEQSVRDEVAWGTPVTTVAKNAGRTRSWVYTALGRADARTEVNRPRLRPVAYLRGAGVDEELWSRLERALWARGIATDRSLASAWHLAYGGTPVVLIDFSVRDAGDIPDGYMRIVRVRARYNDVEDRRPVRAGLTDEDASVLAAQSTRAGEVVVTHTTRTEEFVRVSGGDLPWGGTVWREPGHRATFDEQAISRMAANYLAPDV